MKSPMLARHGQILLLALLMAVALFLRLYGQDWDQGTYQHPDERFIAMVSADRLSFPAVSDLGELFSPSTSPINPRRDDANGNAMSFAYGSLPLYVQGVASALLNAVSDRNWNSYSELYRVGRTLTAVADTLTVLFVFLIGRRLFNPAAGLLAAGLYSFSVLAIQLAHFFAVDTWLTLFVTATIFLTIRFMDSPTFGRSLAIGAVLGLAFATKASVPSLLVPVLFGYGFVFWRSPRRPDILIAASAGALLSVAVFTLFEPYALIRSGPFIEDIRTQARIVRGQTDIPFTRQFVGLTPGVYELRNLFAYTIGPGFLLGALAGVVFAIRNAIVFRDVRLAVPVLWVVAYVPTLITTEARFLRYTLPLLPTLAILTAGLLVWIVAQPGFRRAGQVLTVLVVGTTVIWAIGFMTIYSQEHSRISASRWIHENVPPGSVLTAESWDDPLPVRYPGAPHLSYQIETLDIYGDRPPEDKVEYLHTQLSGVDYVVLSSNRLAFSVDNLPWRYAVQNEFYRRLDAGQLGFRLVYEGLVQPQLFGLTYDDRDADESFTVYDHPHVRIYQKEVDLEPEEFRERFLWSINQPWDPHRYPSDHRLLLDQPVGNISTNDQAGWNALAGGNGLFAAISWLVIIEIIGLGALPLAARVLHRSPDRGAFSARLVGIVVVGWIVWIGASLGLWPATLATVACVVAVIALVLWLPLLLNWSSASRQALPTLKTYVAGLGVFLLIFAVFLMFRALYPDFWQTYYGGEKPFELAYLRAVASSESFPPYDPWYADGVINYYYYGWHLFASVIKLSGVGVSLGFQLAIATIGGLLALQCLAVANLLSWPGSKRVARCLPPAGLLLAFLVVLAGNLDGIRQVVEHRLQVGEFFDFWRSTRVIAFTINEFPFFSLLWADLHPHVMNLPIYVLLITLLIHVVMVSRAVQRDIGNGTGHSLYTLATVAVVLGTIGVTNSWDAPLAIALTIAAFLYAGALRGGFFWLTGAGIGLICVAASFAIFAPFYFGFYSVVDGVEITSSGSPVGQLLTHWGIFFIGIAAVLVTRLLRDRRRFESRSPVLMVIAVFTVGGVLSALVQSFRGLDMPIASSVVAFMLALAILGLGTVPLRLNHGPQWMYAASLALAFAAGLVGPSRPAAAVAGAFAVVAAIVVLKHWRYPLRSLPWALVAVACITIVGVEILYVADDLRDSPWERMNSVFKFYFQAWVLLAIGSAILLAGYVHRTDSLGPRRKAGAYTIGITLLVVLITGSIYPAIGGPARLDQSMPGSPSGMTLDGYVWMNDSWIHNGTGDVIEFSDDLRVIEWLNENVSGAAVVLEASIGPYRGNGSRISSATGLPTVLGWDRHQRQQRHEPGISLRMRDVRQIYNETDPQQKLEMLRRYGVRYIIVGDVERLWNTPDQQDFYASAEGLHAFDDLVGAGLTIAYTSGDTILYAVTDFPRLEPAVDR